MSVERANTVLRYIDEFQNFTTLMLASMMSELRKFGVGLTIAHQHLHQLEPEIRHAVLGNAATIISFRVGAEDAPYIAKEFQPTFDVEDLLNLPNRSIYLKLMIDGTPSRPFSAQTIAAHGQMTARLSLLLDKSWEQRHLHPHHFSLDRQSRGPHYS